MFDRMHQNLILNFVILISAGVTTAMALHIPGLIGIIVFYILILVIGLIAGRKKNKKGDSDDLLVAGRNLGFFVAVMTNTGKHI